MRQAGAVAPSKALLDPSVCGVVKVGVGYWVDLVCPIEPWGPSGPAAVLADARPAEQIVLTGPQENSWQRLASAFQLG